MNPIQEESFWDAVSLRIWADEFAAKLPSQPGYPRKMTYVETRVVLNALGEYRRYFIAAQGLTRNPMQEYQLRVGYQRCGPREVHEAHDAMYAVAVSAEAAAYKLEVIHARPLARRASHISKTRQVFMYRLADMPEDTK